MPLCVGIDVVKHSLEWSLAEPFVATTIACQAERLHPELG